MSENLGKAKIKVEILDELPNITKNIQRYQFDINASAWSSMEGSKYIPPVLIEHVVDTNKTFETLMPAKRKAYVDNYMANGKEESGVSEDKPVILWNVSSVRTGLVYDITKNLENYSTIQPGDYTNAPDNYIGPEWVDAVIPGVAQPNDDGISEIVYQLKTEATDEEEEEETATTTTATSTSVPVPELHVINQRKVRDGLWWEVESSAFLSENMPFWVTIRRAQSPATNNNETCIVLQIGLDDNTNAYDLYLSNQKTPYLIDYVNGRSSMGGTKGIKGISFDADGLKLFEDDEYIEIGVMTIAGRLVFFINDHTLIYTRYQGESDEADTDKGNLKEAKIGAGKIRIFGTNVQVVLDACPMTFSAVGFVALDKVPVIPPQTQTSSSGNISKDWYGVNEKAEAVEGRSVANLPKENGTNRYGVDCLKFVDANVSVYPDGFGYHRNGEVRFKKSSSIGIKRFGDNDFYLLIMKTAYINGGVEFPFSFRGGVPFFFELKGAVRLDGSGGGMGGTDVSSDVIEVAETAQTEEYFFVKKIANVTLYNKGGIYDYLRYQQKGIRLSWGWEDTLTQTFTGIIVSASTSEIPGEEKITLNCQDYSFILQNTPIINSPIYDGMIMFYAAEDIANRAGITNVQNDWASESGSSVEEYFLPSGYTFSQPKVHFDSKQMLFECLKFMLERPEAFAYFDENGKLHIKKLPGGIFSDSGGSISAAFYRDPELGTDNLILDEKTVNYDYNSTVNQINILSVDMDSRNAIVHVKTADSGSDNLMFRKTMLVDQAALGRMDVVVSWTEDLAKRVFYPIRKTGFKTAGSVSTLLPFDFITIDGDEYRLMSLSRKYSAGSNDFTNEYNAEWLGGA